MAGYDKEKARRKWKYKEEKTELQRSFKKMIELLTWANYYLIIIGMILVGIFVKLVVMAW